MYRSRARAWSGCRRSRTETGFNAISAGVIPFRLRHEVAGGAHDEGGRNRQCDVVAAIVGVELGVGVEGVAVPPAACPPSHSRRLVDADLREPLTDEVKVADVARSREDTRQL